MTATWNPQSWRDLPLRQAPDYPDAAAHADAVAQLAVLPPLVLAAEVSELRTRLARVASGEAFLLQGGDCAESFAEFSGAAIRDTSHTLLEMAWVLGARQPVVTVGRIAGQFAKPRSSPTERVGDVELPSYRGDIVNGAGFDADSRRPDPQRLLRAYQQSAITLNLLRALQQTGYATREAMREAMRERHQQRVAQLRAAPDTHALGLLADIHLDGGDQHLYTSHEALLLPYESALTRRDRRSGGWYAGSAHMVWIGDRTRQLDGAHLEFCRGIDNPLGLKCGPSMAPDELLRVLQVLDPQRQAGRVTVIARLGADRVRHDLPPLIRAVRDAGHPVIWSCDPMHGNTVSAVGGRKTRPFDRVCAEVLGFFEVHRAEGSHAGGIHLEMTGTDVTECTGGPQNLTDADLAQRYHTHCDPRLNATQALELACLIRGAMIVTQPQESGIEIAA